MRVRVAWAALALGSAVSLGLVLPSAAQISPFRSAFANGLTNDDFQLLRQAANDLLDREHPVPGATEAWRNPGTGSSGTVAIASTFTHGSYVCHQLTYVTTPNNGPFVQRTKLNWCKTKSGWRIL
jgi:hypothetical protein